MCVCAPRRVGASYRGASDGSPRRRILRGEPVGPRQLVDEAVVLAERAAAERLEAQTAIELVRAHVRRERIDDDGRHPRIGEAALQRQPHHGRAIALAAIGGCADPDVDGAQVRRDLAPIMRLLELRIADLHRADRPPVELGDEVLIERGLHGELVGPFDVLEGDRRVRVVRRARNDVGVVVPEVEPDDVRRRRGPQCHSGHGDGGSFKT